jgi:hypothetical protein
MLHIVKALRRSPAVRQVQVIDLIDEATVKHLKCRAELIDGSALHVNESSIIGKNKYSYHWQDAQNQLTIRWDNAPHHPHLRLFPIIVTKAGPCMRILAFRLTKSWPRLKTASKWRVFYRKHKIIFSPLYRFCYYGRFKNDDAR